MELTAGASFVRTFEPFNGSVFRLNMAASKRNLGFVAFW
jgi:hypothetical protein